MQAKEWGRSLNSKQINHLLRPLRLLDNRTNLVYLALDYLTLALAVGACLAFYHRRANWGLSWWLNVPVTALGIVIIGAAQHRLAGLGHEAAHYTLLKNRFWNETVSDLFCMFPIFATTHQYRHVHMAHHQYTNDWNRDPDLLNIGHSKMMDRFPMSRARFIWNFYIRFFLPHVLLRYLWDIVYLSVFGRGVSPYMAPRSSETPNAVNHSFRWTSILGAAYFFGLVAVLAWINQHQWGIAWLGMVSGFAAIASVTVVALAPASAFFASPIKETYSIKITNSIRLIYYTAFLFLTASLRWWTGENWGKYFLLLWVLPLVTSFAYFMLLRDVYQHANADDGKLTNSRVFFTDALTRWAVFVYGMDMHIPHHLYPAIPHYNLQKCHDLLMKNSAEYAERVVLCHGTFHNSMNQPTILDAMWTPTREPAPTILRVPRSPPAPLASEPPPINPRAAS